MALSAALLSAPVQAQDANFQAAVDALARGAQEEALGLLKKVLAEDPSHEAAYELWQTTEHKVWLKLLTQGGELELITKELMDRASMGRKARQNNPDAIRELVKGLGDEDGKLRTRVVNQLASDFGEYAVPILVYSLGEQTDNEKRVNTMTALTRMGTDVVPPLIEAMDAPDAILRRNVAITLGYIKDPRSKPVLARASENDADSGVKTAAAQSLSRMGGGGDAGQLYLSQGDSYYREDDTVLRPHQYSDVIWHWAGNGLVSVEVPRFLYAPEMAKKAYYRALAPLADAGPALAGIARCAVTEIGRLDEWQAAGQEVGEWAERLKTDDLAAQLAGPAALDLALGWAITQNDMIAASGLCRLMAGTGKSATANLQRALGASKSGAVQGEAAVALGSIAYRNREAASSETVAALTQAASVKVQRIGAVIGIDNPWAGKLSGMGMHENFWPTGARGLASMRSIPGLDLIVISDRLPDLSANQVIDEIRRDPRTAKTPIFVAKSMADTEESNFGGKISGLLEPGADLAAVANAALSERLNRDREEANVLAARAAETLYTLAAGSKTDVAAAAEALAGTLADRSDEIALPALGVLEFVGGATHLERIAAVLSSAERSTPIRVRAAKALAGIFSRSGSADGVILKMLQDVAQKDGAFEVRAAAAGALGRLDLSKDMRVELMRGLLGR